MKISQRLFQSIITLLLISLLTTAGQAEGPANEAAPGLRPLESQLNPTGRLTLSRDPSEEPDFRPANRSQAETWDSAPAPSLATLDGLTANGSSTPRLPGATTPFTELTGFDNPLYLISHDVNVFGEGYPAFADIDADGDMDAFIGFDGSSFVGDGVRYFENTGDAQRPIFEVRSGSANPLDSVIYPHPTLVDLDQDNDYDAIIGDVHGNVYYYENIGDPQRPIFVERTGSDNPFAIVVGYGGSPALVDIDQDNDFDVMIGDGNNLISYYENTGNAHNPIFTKANPLLGGWSIVPTLVDIDQDNDFDAFIKVYVSAQYDIHYFENRGDAQNPQFGFANNPLAIANVKEDPNPTFVDIDGDNDFDVFISNDDGMLFSGRLYYYENTGDAQNPTFSELTGFANPFNGLRQSAPALVDIDQDGDLDAFIGAGIGNPPFTSSGKIYYYENIGDAQNPTFIFRAESANPLVMVDVGEDSKPAFVDIDGDGDFDLFVGGNEGSIKYYENIGGVQTPDFILQTNTANPLSGVDVGNGSAPAFVDINADGDFDLFIGETHQNAPACTDLNYYENVGTPQSPSFMPGSPNPLGQCKIDKDFLVPTFVDIDGDGDFDAFIGFDDLEEGVQYYENIGTAQAPNFIDRGNAAPLNADVSSYFGSRPAPTFGDIDGDGDFDAFIGSGSGRVYYYRNNAASNPPRANDDTATTLKGVPLTIDVLSNDSDPDGDTLSISAVGRPTNGSASTNSSAVIYTPTTTFTGAAVFTYTASDGQLSDTATVTVTITLGGQTVVVAPATATTLVYAGPQPSHPVTTTLAIPAGAVTETISLIYTEQPSSLHAAPAGFRFAGRFFTLEATLGGVNQPGFVFSKPLTMTLDYNPADLTGLDEAQLALQFWDALNQRWSDNGITLLTRDTPHHRLIITLTHLTEFALLGPETTRSIYLPLVVK